MYFLFVSTLVLSLDTSNGMLRRHSIASFHPHPWSDPDTGNYWAVEINGGVMIANQLAAKHGFINLGKVGNFKNHYHFQFLINNSSTSVGDGAGYVKSVNYRHIHDQTIGSLAEIGLQPALTSRLKSEHPVGRVEQLRLKRHSKKEFMHPTDPRFNREWSLLNTGQIGSMPFLDINVERAWMQGITGAGVVVGIVDDGLEHTHPDLQANYDSYTSYDFVFNDSDPTPTKYTGDEPDRHGTSCAGEVAMSKDNNNCGVGVAYGCKISGLKLDIDDSNDVSEASALGHKSNYVDVYSNSWGPSDFGFIVDGPGYYLARTFEEGVKLGRNGLGSIFIWAAGNGGLNYDSCAADGYASSIYTIAVGSADQDGRQADYDEFCSSKMAVTFSYDSHTFPSQDETWTAYNQLTTTTLNGRCTDDFTGTSASTPLLSGAAALALQANPQLTWRDMQYLVVYTSDTSLLVGGDWQTNGAGLKVSHKFGFGAIDAEAMVTRARKWTNVPDKHIYVVQPLSRSYAPIFSSWTTTFIVRREYVDIVYLEHVVVNMSIALYNYGVGYDVNDFEIESSNLDDDDLYQWLKDPHPRRGDIKIELTSPQGTVSTLLPYRNYDFVNEEGYSDWPFMSVQHWGEDPVGTWTLEVTFRSSSSSSGARVAASGISMTLHGTATVPFSVLAIPATCHSACARSCSGGNSSDCDGCKDYRVASTLECVSACPNTTYVHNKYCLTGPRQPDHKIIYPGDNRPNIYVYIGGGMAGLLLLVVLILVAAVWFVIARKRSRRSTGRRRFRYSPISPTAV